MVSTEHASTGEKKTETFVFKHFNMRHSVTSEIKSKYFMQVLVKIYDL